MTTIKAPPKECEHCGRRFYHDPRQSYERWVTRQFCGRDCFLSHRLLHARLRKAERRIAIAMYRQKQRAAEPLVLRHRVPSTEAVPVWKITIIKK